jgi:hypothetical protein
VAREWVTENAARGTGFGGAYFSGSTIGLPDQANLPPASDVDIAVVTSLTDPPRKPGEFSLGSPLSQRAIRPFLS